MKKGGDLQTDTDEKKKKKCAGPSKKKNLGKKVKKQREKD